MAGTRYQVTFLGKSDFKAVLDDINKLTGKTYEIKFTANGKGLDNLDKKVQQVSKGLDTGSNKAKSFDSSMSNVGSGGGKQLTSLSAKIKNVGNDFLTTTKKVAKFGMSTAAIGLVTKGIHSAGQAVLELDNTMTDFKKVSDLNGESLTNYVNKLGEFTSEVGRSKSQLLSASAEFVKSGFSEEDSAILSRVASLFQNVADSELTAGESANFITSQMKAFNIEAENSEHIIDAVNEVSNRFAVSSTDISSALSKTSSAMGVLGNSFEETIGLTTAGTELLQNQAGKVARGLRTIGNNFASAAKSSKTFSIQVKGAEKQISLYDETTGDMRSTFEIFEQLNQYWDDMSQSEKQAVAISYAGKVVLARNRFNCWKLLKVIIPNFNSNIVVA